MFFLVFVANLPAKFHLGLCPISARYGYPSYLSCPKNCHTVVVVIVISIVVVVVVVVGFSFGSLVNR